MSQFCGVHRLPRAGVDPVVSASAAIAVIRLAIHRPLRPETIVLLLDAELRGRTIVAVDGTEHHDAVLDVVERMAESIADAAGPSGGVGGSLVVATVRPGGGPEPGDADRWLEASEIADHVGVELLEWFVIDDETGPTSAWCPRDLLGEPPRWPR